MSEPSTKRDLHRPLLIGLSAVLVCGAALTLGPLAGSIDARATSGTSSSSAENGQEQAALHPLDIQVRANEQIGLRRSQLVQLPELEMTAQALSIAIPFDGGQLRSFELMPHSVRSPDKYRVRKQVDGGELVDLEPGPIRTVRGHVEEIPGARVAGSILDDGLHLIVTMPDGDRHVIEAIQDRVDGARPGDHIVYRLEDAECEKGECGVPDHWMPPLRPRDHDPAPNAEGSLAGEVCKIAELAIDADFPFYQAWNSSTSAVENRINNIINAVNDQYEAEVGIIHEITQIIIRTSSSENPYNPSSAGNLLNQFGSTWNSFPESQIPRDVAHLFTGLSFGGTLGIAALGTVCNVGSAYGLSVNISNNFACATDLTSHELGHNWNATHTPNFTQTTMNAGLTCTNVFATLSINQISSYRDAVNCLETCPDPTPPNNTCSNSIFLGNGSFAYTNVGATTNGPPESCPSSDNNIQADVWFSYIASCTGTVTFSLCDSDYNTKLGIYLNNCPSSPGSIVACDHNSCPGSNRSEITLDVEQGDFFRIRVGGQNGAQGDGVLNISCEAAGVPTCEGNCGGESFGCWCDEDCFANGDCCDDVCEFCDDLDGCNSCEGICGEQAPGGCWCDASCVDNGDCCFDACDLCDHCEVDDTCLGDLNGEGVVNVFDLLDLLGSWGECVDCPQDLNDDDLVNVFDLLILLDNWGPCDD